MCIRDSIAPAELEAAMKGLLAFVAIAVVALLAYNYVHTGRLALIPSSLSRDEQALQRIEERFDTARRQFEAAGRAAGVAGADTTADADAARRDIDKADAGIADLRAHRGGAADARGGAVAGTVRAEEVRRPVPDAGRPGVARPAGLQLRPAPPPASGVCHGRRSALASHDDSRQRLGLSLI